MSRITPDDVDRMFGWHIESRPTFTHDSNGAFIEVPGKRTLVRTDREHALGVVTQGYGIIQPAAMMSLLHAAAGDGTIEYINGGSFNHGARIYLQAKLHGESFTVAGQDHEAYIIIGAHNDGTGSQFACFTPIRLFCMNQLRLAMNRAMSRLSIRHTTRAAERMAQATAMIERARGYFGEFHATALQLVRQQYTLQDMRQLATELWPDPTKGSDEGVKRTRAHVVRLFDGEQRGGQQIAGTAYGALNAVAEYVDHHQVRRGGQEARLNAGMFGSQPQQLKEKAFELLKAAA